MGKKKGEGQSERLGRPTRSKAKNFITPSGFDQAQQLLRKVFNILHLFYAGYEFKPVAGGDCGARLQARGPASLALALTPPPPDSVRSLSHPDPALSEPYCTRMCTSLKSKQRKTRSPDT